MQMYGKFAGFPINSALFGLVSYNDPCFHDMLFFHTTIIPGCMKPFEFWDVPIVVTYYTTCNWNAGPGV